MSRRKLTVVEQAVKDAAKELGLPKDHWDVERLATMQVMLKVARHKWASGQSSSAAGDMLQLMAEITTLRKEARVEPMEVNIKYASAFVGVADIECKYCHKTARYEVSEKPFDKPAQAPATEQPPTGHGNAIAANNGSARDPLSADDTRVADKPATDAPAESRVAGKPLMQVTYREGVSG
jgi:hypothetical protein